MNHYTYQITKISIQKHYIGAKSCEELPVDNIGYKYFSSSTNLEFIQDQKNNTDDYSYTVLREFDSREEAISHEIYLHNYNDVAKNPKYYNKAKQTSTGFDTSGCEPWNKGRSMEPGEHWNLGNETPESTKQKMRNNMPDHSGKNNPRFGKNPNENLSAEKLKENGLSKSKKMKHKPKCQCEHCDKFYDKGNYIKNHGDKCNNKTKGKI